MWLGRLHEWASQGVPCALVTIVEASGSTPRGVGAKMAVNAGGEIAGSVGGGAVEHHCVHAAREVMDTGVPRLLRFVMNGKEWTVGTDTRDFGACGGTVSVFIEPVLAPAELVAFGAGHIAESLGRLCAALGMPFRVYDDRPEFATRERYPEAKETIVAPYGELAAHIRLGPASHCVILTHGHVHDEKVLEQLLALPALPYIGMIGSAIKVRQAFAKLRAKGVEPDHRVYSPVGLALGGGLPGDIALAILAEVRMLQFGGDGRHLRIQEDPKPEAPVTE